MRTKLQVCAAAVTTIWSLLCMGSVLLADCQGYLTKPGLSAVARMGFSVAMIGDINGDDIDDFAIGAPGKIGASAPYGQAWTDSTGHVYLYSGYNGALIRSHEESRTPLNTKNGELGYSVAAAGDADADGIPDYVVGAPTSTCGSATVKGKVEVFSGSSGISIGFLNGTYGGSRTGSCVARLGDVNNDDKDEVLIGAPGQSGIAGRVYVARCNNGYLQVLDTLKGASGTYAFGSDVSGVDDLTGDGVPDILVAQNSPTLRKVFIFNGATRVKIDSLAGLGSGITTPIKVLGIGDVNWDGYGDFAVGYSKPSGNGEVRLFSGLNRSPLHTYTGTVPGFGVSISAAGDFDNDDVPDILIGQGGGSTYVYSCSDPSYSLISTMTGSGDFGTAVAGPKGTDNDGYGLTIAGAPTSNSAVVFSCGFPEVYFWGSPLHGIPPVTVAFHGEPLTPDITSWSWDFGDDSTSALQNPSHSYDSNVGAYTVSLIATGFHGADTVIYVDYVSFALQYDCGDVNGDGAVDISDRVYLQAFIFGGGPAPIGSGDVNCDTSVDISDCVYLINYIFGGGPAPCAACK
jgi:PKD repeat protein